MNNTATRMIRSEEITIDMRICTILAGGKKPGEVYFAAIAPDMELTVITLDVLFHVFPEHGDDCYAVYGAGQRP